MKAVSIALVLMAVLWGPNARMAMAEPVPGGSLENLTQLSDVQMKRLSSYDRTGGNRDGLHDAPILPGETRTIAEIDGEGVIAHIWCTVSSREHTHLRKLVVRMYWDGEETPSVEVPLGDFFALGHALYYDVNSEPIQTANSQGMNCYWRMPFENGARITLTNEGETEARRFFFHINYYSGTELVDSPARFHAQYRQAFPTVRGEDYEVLAAKGKGLYVGTVLSVNVLEPEWWGEGDERVYVDGAEEPQFHGTGTEDYFGGAWCYPRPEPFNRQYFGNPLRGSDDIGGRWSVYRFHVQDPIPFQESIRFTLEHGHASERADNWSSVAYWYQTEPHAPFPALPPGDERVE